MRRHLPLIGVILLTGGCGLADTAVTGAPAGAAAADQAREAKATEERVQQEVEAAQKAAAEQREQADAAQ